MLTEKEVEDYFKTKNVEYSILKTVKMKLKNGTHEHHFSYPETLEQLDAMFIKARDELLFAQGRVNRLNAPRDIQENAPQPEEGCCHESKKTWGAETATKSVLSGKTSDEIAKSRLDMCSNCQIKDIDGQRLYRIIKDVPYCGIPRFSEVSKIRRFERDYGCGCGLKLKVQYNNSQCPFGAW